MFCVNCGVEIDESHDFCPKCGNKKNESKPKFERPIEWKSVPLTIVLSIVLSGIGHIYIEQIKKGIIFIAVGFTLAVFMWIELLLLIPLIPFYAWVIYDSYKQVKLYNKFVEENGKKPEW